MKRSFFHYAGVVALMLFAVASVTDAAITNIKNNSVNLSNDMNWNSVTSLLSFDTSDMSGPGDTLSVYQDGNLLTDWVSAAAYDVDLHMETSFQDFGVTLTDPTRAYFTGGYLDLTFTYDDWISPQSCRLGGAITEGSMRATLSGANTVFEGVFLFDTNDATYGHEVMPDGDVWPALGLSAAVTLSWTMSGDLTGFDWSEDFPQDNVTDTIFDFVPTEVAIPEPASLALMAFGGLPLVLRRKRS